MRWEGQSSYICCSLEHGCFGSCSLSVLGVFRVARVDLCGALSPVCLGEEGVDGLSALLSVRLANFAVRVLEIEDGATRFCSVIGGAGDFLFVKNLFMQASGLCDGDLIEGCFRPTQATSASDTSGQGTEAWPNCCLKTVGMGRGRTCRPWPRLPSRLSMRCAFFSDYAWDFGAALRKWLRENWK